MIDTDKYEGCITDMKGYDLAILAEELLAEVKRMREGIERILKTYHFPFIISGMKQELKEMIK